MNKIENADGEHEDVTYVSDSKAVKNNENALLDMMEPYVHGSRIHHWIHHQRQTWGRRCLVVRLRYWK
ncbi:AIF_collapsed_G0031930.mRNA.1.CDS.1 [Saccharomyces cerevisiae]|nr:AIF_collapsed_G0031930.mRNA.1.CDS.1 [Saccharomyces cerevisiae]